MTVLWDVDAGRTDFTRGTEVAVPNVGGADLGHHATGITAHRRNRAWAMGKREIYVRIFLKNNNNFKLLVDVYKHGYKLVQLCYSDNTICKIFFM